MRFREINYHCGEFPRLPCPSFGNWETYSTSKMWIITPPMENFDRNIVEVQFRDQADNISTTYSDYIMLDTILPTDGTLTATAGNTQVSFSWSGFSDTKSGIKNYKLVFSTAGTPDTCNNGTEIYSGAETSYSHINLSNGTPYYYRLCAIDNATNMSAGAIASATPISSSLPDLVILDITTDPVNPQPNQNINVTIIVQNQGSVAVPFFYVDFYKHLSTAPSTYQMGDFYCPIRDLLAGQSTTCTNFATPISYDSAGIYSMWAQADTEKHATESDESNNVIGPTSITIGVAQWMGDINKDGQVDISDVILELRIALCLDYCNEAPPACSDINADGQVDISDVILTLRFALELDQKRACI